MLCVAMFSTGCGASMPHAPAYPTDDPFFAEPEPERLPGVTNDEPAPRVIMPGDMVSVQVMSAETTTYEDLVVDCTGRIHLPLIGEVEIGSLSLSDAEQAVKSAMTRFDKLAEVAVVMSQPDGHVVTVLGAVPERGRLTLPPGARLADVLALAGGPLMSEDEGPLTPLADLEAARLYREGKLVPVSIPKAIEGDPRHNVYVHPGDHLYVPPVSGKAISVIGEVGTPRLVEYRPNIRLTEALAMAGGPTQDAAQRKIRILRGSLAAPRVYEMNLSDLVDGKGHDVELAAGDVVYVPEHWKTGVRDAVTIVTPILAVITSFALVYFMSQGGFGGGGGD